MARGFPDTQQELQSSWVSYFNVSPIQLNSLTLEISFEVNFSLRKKRCARARRSVFNVWFLYLPPDGDETGSWLDSKTSKFC